MNAYYVLISPFIFENNFLEKHKKEIRSIEAVLMKFNDLKNLFIFIINNDKWWSIINKYFQLLNDDDFAQDIKSYLEQLERKNRLIILNNDCIYANEQDFFRCEKNFDHIIATINNPLKFFIPSEFKKKNYDDSYIVDKLNKEEIEKIFEKVLSIAEKIEIIDPYFIIHYKKEIVDMIEKYAAKKLNKKAKIVFHIRYRKDDQYYNKNKNEWRKIINNSKHNIFVYFWDDSNSKTKMHDRYIITNNTIISIGKGLEFHDEYYRTSTSCSFHDNKFAENLLKDYRENSTNFELMEFLK